MLVAKLAAGVSFPGTRVLRSNADSSNGNHHSDEDRKESKDRIDGNPPYGAGKVVRVQETPCGVVCPPDSRRSVRPARCGSAAEAVTL